jgi:hypothetical protein
MKKIAQQRAIKKDKTIKILFFITNILFVILSNSEESKFFVAMLIRMTI